MSITNSLYELVILFIPAWMIALVALINMILFIIKSKTNARYTPPKVMYRIRALSMFLWFFFYSLIAVDNFIYDAFLQPKHLAMVRLSFFWELNVSLFYSISALVNIHRVSKDE